MVNIDTVYQNVLALANKEQRGYITPQEFNLFANQAQQDIFEQYFYDLNAFRLRGIQMQMGELHEIGDSVKMIMEKLSTTGGVTVTNSAGVTNGVTLPPGRTGRIFVTIGGIRKTLRLVQEDVIHNLRNSRWHKKLFNEALYFEDGYKRIQVWNGAGQVVGTNVTCENVTGKPGLVIWNYTIVNEKAMYNATNSVDFDLPPEEQPDLVAKILKLAGISIEDPLLYQAGGQEEQQNTQQESK